MYYTKTTGARGAHNGWSETTMAYNTFFQHIEKVLRINTLWLGP